MSQELPPNQEFLGNDFAEAWKACPAESFESPETDQPSSEVLEILADPIKILRGYTRKHAAKGAHSPIDRLFQERVRERLANRHAKGYVQSLRQLSRARLGIRD